MEDVVFIALCALLGVVSGFLGGLLGIGGGVVIVPVLSIYFDGTDRFDPGESLLIAVATSLACIVFTSASAAYTQYKANKVLWPVARKLVTFLLVGSFLAGYVAPLFPAEVFRLFIGVFLAFVATVMLLSWQPAPHRQLPGVAGCSGIGFGGGLLAGMAGIAGGNVIVPTLVYFNVPAHNATATSSALGVPIALTGALGYFFLSPPVSASGLVGYIDAAAFLPIVLGALVAAPLGVKVAHRLPAAKLKRLFGVLLVFVSARMIITAIWP
jgi:uncharacterized membrane protein YfcA